MPVNGDAECDGAGNGGAINTWLNSWSGDDDCGNATVTNNYGTPGHVLSDDCGATGSVTVTFTLTDDCGNDITKDATFTIHDNTPPVALCQNITVNLDAFGTASITASQLDNGSSDNCSGVTFGASATTFTCEDLGQNIVTLTVTDACGLTNTCTSIVTVQDLIPPVIDCPDDASMNNDPGVCGAVYNYTVTYTDNCYASCPTSLPGYTSQGTFNGHHYFRSTASCKLANG
jgi:hypothetical protein